MAHLTPTFSSFCMQRTLLQLNFLDNLTRLHHIQAAVLHALATSGVLAMSTPEPSPAPGPQPNKKLLVIEFLNAHLVNSAIDQGGYNMLYRMVEMISAIGKVMHSLAHSPLHSVQPSVLHEVENYARCVLEGCSRCMMHFKNQVQWAESRAKGLPELGGSWEGNDELLKGKMRVWRDVMRTLHLPTANDARLFRHMANHYFDVVYFDFMELHRRHPDNAIWEVNELLTTIQHALDDIQHKCIAADAVVEGVEDRFNGGIKKLKTWLQEEKKRSATVSAPQSQAATSVVNTPRTAIKMPPTPCTGDGPPQLPPLLFQLPGGDDTDLFATTAALQIEATAADLQLTQSLSVDPFVIPPTLEVDDAAAHLHLTQSFGAIEEKVAQRSHFRAPTTGYTANPRPALAVGIANVDPRRQIVRGAPVGDRRRSNKSTVPRVFTGSLSELERRIFDLDLHRVKTPEDQPGSPVVSSPPSKATVGKDCGAQAPRTPAVYPNPDTPMQRQEALDNEDADWNNGVAHGEVIRRRRAAPREGKTPPRSEPTIDQRPEQLEAWLRQKAPVENPAPGTPDTAM
ncbi:hypothetical protein LTR08_004243 [Meristemomyces frigidus]|nr:hypothetical protein LTR08_004243 [Meristemomyces frigidus]